MQLAPVYCIKQAIDTANQVEAKLFGEVTCTAEEFAASAPNTGDRTIRDLQSSLPWTGHYHRDFRATPMVHKDFAHALLHVHKAGGVLASVVNEAEHGGHDFAHDQVAKYVADLVICALRMANTCPNGVIDLQRQVEERIAGKNAELGDVATRLAAAERGR